MLHEDRQTNRKLWAARSTEFSQSNMTLRSWCEANGISYSAMRYWQRIFSTAKSQPKQNQDLQWIPLTSAVPAENHRSPSPHSHSSTLIKVSIGKCVVDVPENFQPDQLYCLLKVLNAL